MENHFENIDGCHYLGNFLVSSDKNIENAVIREGTKMVCAWAFKGRKNLVSVTFPASVKIIGDQAFCGCEKLREICFPSDGLKIIEDSAFTGCLGVKKIDIPDSCHRISDIAFISNTGKKILYPDYAYIPGIDPKSCNTIQAEFYANCYATSFERHSAEEQQIYDEYIVKHKSKYLAKLLEPLKLGCLGHVGEKVLTAKNITELIDTASKNKNTEAVAFLMNWKEEHGLYPKSKKGGK
ncbi:MAG: leucine-rich repeat domain-containing protein [Oscillospiraceae bacterium]|nr:leucine-rich repeat domain-containing protein [Oscillospiraceae bacterium]